MKWMTTLCTALLERVPWIVFYHGGFWIHVPETHLIQTRCSKMLVHPDDPSRAADNDTVRTDV